MLVLGFDQALETVRQHATERTEGLGARQPTTEQVSLLDAQGRVLAENVLAERDQPPFDRSTRDGFAVMADTLSATGEAGLQVIGEVRAGDRWQGPALQPGKAIAIMTGAPLPPGTDAVVMVEHTQREGDRLTLLTGRVLRAGDNVVPRGAEARAGDCLLTPGTSVGAAEIGLAASCGRNSLEVYARPTVVIIATGDELVELSQSPEPWQIRNSNGYALAALVHHAGGAAVQLEIARDTREQVRERIVQGRQADLLLLSGGVSMGEYDLVEEVLAEFGAEFFFTGVRMQPGRPVVFGRLPRREHASGAAPECLFFGLPGNPVSTEVTFHCFVKPLLRVLGGGRWTGPSFVQATLTDDVAVKPGLTRLLPARLVSSRQRPEVCPVQWQGSGDLAANARANSYAVFPEDAEHLPAESIVTVLLR